MSDYTDIKHYLDKAKINILNAIRCVETMENEVGTVDNYQALISDMESITEIIDKCEINSDDLTDLYERER